MHIAFLKNMHIKAIGIVRFSRHDPDLISPDSRICDFKTHAAGNRCF